MIGHFNAGELASYRAGTVSGGKAARIGAHLSSCPQCAGVDSGLANVSQLLGSIPAPSMPEVLALRLQAVIADEATRRALGPAGLGEADRSTARNRSRVPIPGRPDLPGRGRRHVRRRRAGAWASPLLLRGLAAAGALVLLVGGGILLANQRGVQMSSSREAGQGPAARSIRPRPNSAAPVGSAAVLRLRYQRGAKIAYTNVVTSDVNYTKTDLPGRIRHEVANAAQIGNASTGVAPATPQAGPERPVSHTTVGQLESCLSALAAGRLVQLVQIARYLGRPATIIVFEPVGNAFEVIVVGATCGATSQDIITTLTVPTK